MSNNVTAGEPFRRVVHSSQQVAGAKLTPPGDGESRPLSAVPLDQGPSDLGPAVAIDVADTRRAGLYRLGWDEGTLGTQQDLFTANPDSRESALERIAQPELTAMLRPLRVDIASARNGAELLAPTGRELWHELAWGLFVLLIVESLLASWVGRSR